MKKLLFYSLFALTLLAVPSCGDDDEDEPTNTPSGMPHNPSNDTNPDNETGTDTCNEPATKPETFTVTFDTDGGGEVSAQTVEDGKPATKPADPTKENCTFRGWYLGDNEFDFSVAVTADITLKARYKYADAFSVSETKQVYFAKGNLQYHCKNKEWRFAPLQYDRIGDDNANIADGYDGYIDLFGWGTGDNPTLASEYNADYASFTDWGNNIKDGNVWQTLTLDEWYYLIHSRKNASEKYGVAEVAGVQGLIFLPDDWVLPEGISFHVKGSNYFSIINKYTVEDWQKMESSGATFLPAAGDRYGTSVSNVGNYGVYWSSTVGGTAAAFGLYFGSDLVYMNADFRYYGRSVRLVRSL